MAGKAYDFLFKILLIGDFGVGKAELLFRFVDDVDAVFISTIGIDFKIKTVELKGKKIKLQIWDTAGQERFHTITSSCYRGAMGVMLVYDITQKSSFDNVLNWLRNIREHTEDVEIVLLRNRCDMADKRMISKESGQRVAEENGIKFIEVSAKSNINIEAAFMTLTEDILEKGAKSAIVPAAPGFPASLAMKGLQPDRSSGEQGDASGTVKPEEDVGGPRGKSRCC